MKITAKIKPNGQTMRRVKILLTEAAGRLLVSSQSTVVFVGQARFSDEVH